MSKTIHMAGIVPCTRQRSERFNFPWDDWLMPIGSSYLAVERAVLECAMAGCKTIWVIADTRSQPIMKHRMNDSILDPLSYNRMYASFPNLLRREIPIFYTALHPKDQDRRDSQVWSFLYGATVADRVSRQMSDWLAPHKFYVANPFALYPVHRMLRQRRNIYDKKKRFVVTTPDGRDFTNGAYTGFTCNVTEVKEWVRSFKSKEVGLYDPESYKDDIRNKKRLPLEKRYSGRRMTFEDIFSGFDVQKNVEGVVEYEIPWYHQLDGFAEWHSYCREQKPLYLPKYLFRQRVWTRIGQDEMRFLEKED